LTAVRRVVVSGWWPALLVATVAGFLIHRNGLVSLPDTLAYTSWFVWACTLPGTLLWRLLDWRRGPGRRSGRPLLEDLVLGSILGLAAVVPVHLAMTALGHAGLVLLWPVVVTAAFVAVPRGRDLLLIRQLTPTPVWWSWSLALLMLYVVLRSGETFWFDLALTPRSLRAPYVDEPFHQSLVVEFAQHFPAQVPYVSGTPVRYHWLVYPFVAAGVVGSGVEPVPLLRLLVPALLSFLLILGVAVAAARLSGHRWAALGAVVVLCLLSPLDVMGWTPVDAPWVEIPWASYRSPTQAMASALCPLLVVMLVGMLRGAWSGVNAWVATGAMMLAVAGAKSAMLPLFVAGLSGTFVVMLLLRRRTAWRVGALAGMSLGVFALATVIFYGAGARALSFSPFQVVDNQAVRLGLSNPAEPADLSVRLLLTLVLLVCSVVPLLGGLGLFVRGGWRRPTGWVLTGCFAAAMSVLLLFHHPSYSQYYFRYSALVPMALLGALGWARATGRITRRTVVVQAPAAAVGLAAAYLIAAVTSGTPPEEWTGSQAARLFDAFVVPLGLAALVVLAATVVVLVLNRFVTHVGQVLPVLIAMLVGMCLPFQQSVAADLFNDRERAVSGNVLIRPGGLAAATWLKEHSGSDHLVATNLHTRTPVRNPRDYRSFWIAAWSERRVLVHGWAYIEPTSVGLPSNEETNRSAGPPFWDPVRLALNDEVFSEPTEENIRTLRDKYGVDWLFAAHSKPVDLRGLARLTVERHTNRNYSVFEIPADETTDPTH